MPREFAICYCYLWNQWDWVLCLLFVLFWSGASMRLTLTVFWLNLRATWCGMHFPIPIPSPSLQIFFYFINYRQRMRLSDPPIALHTHAHILQFVNTVLATFIVKLRLAVVFSVQSVMLAWPPALWCKSTFSDSN